MMIKDAGNKDRRKKLKGFDFERNTYKTADIGVTIKILGLPLLSYLKLQVQANICTRSRMNDI